MKIFRTKIFQVRCGSQKKKKKRKLNTKTCTETAMRYEIYASNLPGTNNPVEEIHGGH